MFGTWREGFKAAYTKALEFKTWDEMYAWAKLGQFSVVLPLRPALSTDRAGGKHTYVNTFSGGFKDGCISIFEEMRFIRDHNSGGIENFFRIVTEWVKMQHPDEIIPPGHF